MFEKQFITVHFWNVLINYDIQATGSLSSINKSCKTKLSKINQISTYFQLFFKIGLWKKSNVDYSKQIKLQIKNYFWERNEFSNFVWWMNGQKYREECFCGRFLTIQKQNYNNNQSSKQFQEDLEARTFIFSI